MRIPDATYRLQFNPEFRFRDALEIIPYLAALGISDVYASPIFYAAEGSTHGYDVCDHGRLNPELGTDEDFELLGRKVREFSMGWLQDIIPNHMAYSAGNAKLMDTLKFGPDSAYTNFFDIDWDHPAFRGKLLAPFLGKHYSECVEGGEIELRARGNWANMGYYALELPLSHKTSFCLESRDKGSKGAYTAKDLSGSGPSLDEIMASQFFAPSYWRRADEEINYRRFFTINGLISIRVEEKSVFEEVHRFLFELAGQGKITGLRVDHIDGLYDPAGYLEDLNEASGGMYTVVEKILGLTEDIPAGWPVQGSTGYKFLNYVNGLFCKHGNGPVISRIYTDFSGNAEPFSETVRSRKRFILENHMGGDLDNLSRLLHGIAARSARGRDFSLKGIREGLAEVLCVFPVYRSYAGEEGSSPEDRVRIAESVEKAKALLPGRAPEIGFTGMVLLGDDRGGEAEGRLHFLRRFQQITGPLMAKGYEDTALYLYSRLISLNEVGGDPERFGICPSIFHSYAENEAARWPHALNATATHDTKRGEDARARINVLSEMPFNWQKNLDLWSAANYPRKRMARGRAVPDPNMEYFLYQSLLGAYPFDEREKETFRARFQDYIVKAAREAKVFTDWSDPDGDYEAALRDFAGDVLDPAVSGEFLGYFFPFQEEVAHYGIYNSLSQTLIKLTAPGIPDTYRGTELWSLDFVDPDNRRPVDFGLRKSMLEEMKEKAENGLQKLAADLLESRRDGRIKLYVIWRALTARKEQGAAFRGSYRPVKCSGTRRDNLVSFMREGGGCKALVIAPRFFTALAPRGKEPVGREAWHDTTISSSDLGGTPWINVFTGKEIGGEEVMPVAEILTDFPIALLTNKYVKI